VITLFHAPRTRSQKVMWMLEEMGLAYEVRPVAFLEREQDAEFVGLNPAGFLPVMKDGDTVLLESAAMMEYVAARYGPTPLVPGPTDKTYPAYLQYFHFGEASLAAPLIIIPYSLYFAPPEHRDNYGAEIARQIFRRRLPLVEQRLAEAPYMAGDAFTAADISVAYALGIGKWCKAIDDYSPAVGDYMQRVGARPGYQAMRARA
jgi:glutathione S-transferase